MLEKIVGKNHLSIMIASMIAIIILTLLIVSPFPDAIAFKCSKVTDGADGPCWYCVSSSGLHHTWLGSGCGNGS